VARDESDASEERPPSTPHDGLFKFTFAQPEHAEGLLRTLLPSEALARMDMSTLEQLPGSFVEPALSDLESDLLYRVRIAEREALIMLLIEHQSRIYPMMPYRLARYVADKRTLSGEEVASVMVYIHVMSDIPVEELRAFVRDDTYHNPEEVMSPAEKLLHMIGPPKWREEGRVELLLKLLARRFGPLSDEIHGRLQHATAAELDAMGERVLDAQTLDEVLG
jgi:hypothetical protein